MRERKSEQVPPTESVEQPRTDGASADPTDSAAVSPADDDRTLSQPLDGFFSEDSGGGTPIDSSSLAPMSPHGRGSAGDLGGTIPVPPAFADYQILEEISHGGMGIVFKAEQKSLNRIVAIKMMAPVMEFSLRSRARFRTEAQAMASLDHTNIVKIHEVGEESGHAFFSMEFVSGGDLAQRLAKGHLSQRQAASYIREIAEAVQFAHDHGVLHRDLKPQNILLTEDDIPKVCDFGLAKLLDDEAGVSETGKISGTLWYMAPEQLNADRSAISTRTDVWALGVILCQLLTGELPFQGADRLELQRNILQKEPSVMFDRRRKIDRDLAAICAKCLEKDPRQRLNSAGELAAQLGYHLEGRPVTIRPVGRLERTWRWCRRNPLVAGLTATVFVLLLAGSIVSGLVAKREASRASREIGLRYENYITSARLLGYQGEWSQVVMMLTDALATGRGSATDLRLAIIEALLADSDVSRAHEALQRESGDPNVNPHAAKIQLYRGDLAFVLGDPDSGRAWLTAALKMGLDQADAAYARAMLADDPEVAITELENAVKWDPFHLQAGSHLLMTQLLEFDTVDARTTAERLRERYPNACGSHLALDWLGAMEGDQDQSPAQLKMTGDRMSNVQTQMHRAICAKMGQEKMVREEAAKWTDLRDYLRGWQQGGLHTTVQLYLETVRDLAAMTALDSVRPDAAAFVRLTVRVPPAVAAYYPTNEEVQQILNKNDAEAWIQLMTSLSRAPSSELTEFLRGIALVPLLSGQETAEDHARLKPKLAAARDAFRSAAAKGTLCPQESYFMAAFCSQILANWGDSQGEQEALHDFFQGRASGPYTLKDHAKMAFNAARLAGEREKSHEFMIDMNGMEISEAEQWQLQALFHWSFDEPLEAYLAARAWSKLEPNNKIAQLIIKETTEKAEQVFSQDVGPN